MIKVFRPALAAVALLLGMPGFAAAQLDVPGFEVVLAHQWERLPGNRYRFVGSVEMLQKDMRFYADQVEYYGDTDRLVASGNVLVSQTDHQIAADRADFNAKTRLGTFYNARGFAAVGASAEDVTGSGTLEPDVQFYGETL